jgi:hypothetical protein
MGQEFVRTQGSLVLDTNNTPILLKGVNLGGWLVQENWMCGITDSTDVNYGRDQITTLEDRFNDSQVEELINTWQENWITDDDFSFIQSHGFNFVRVPFGYRNLQDKYLNWKLDSTGNVNFEIFDEIVERAKNHNLYVLFDYHVWLNQDEQYSSISDQDTVINHTVQIWKEFATHFKDSKVVLGYDLLNEPTSSWNDYVMDMIYDSIRSIDANHMISIEWTNPDTSRWTNILYQGHFYNLYHNNLSLNMAAFESECAPIFDLHESLNVPFYVGETHCYTSDSTWVWSLNEYCQRNIHWSPWTYKTVNQWGWGLLNVDYNSAHVNLNTDDYLTIKSKWQDLSNPSNLYYLNNLIDIWSAATTCNTLEIPVVAQDDEFSFSFDIIESTLTVFDNLNFSIVNSIGQEVFHNNNLEKIDLNFLNPGIYYIVKRERNLGKFVKY